MKKRITALSTHPHTVSLVDRPSSLFIDPTSGSIFVDEGDGEGRMNGVVFSVSNAPVFNVRQSVGTNWQLVLDYRGTGYEIGVSGDEAGLRGWVASANTLLRQASNRLIVSNGAGNGRHTAAVGAISPNDKAT